MSRLRRALRSFADGLAPDRRSPPAVGDPDNHADRAVALFVALRTSFTAPGVASVFREEVPAGGPCHLWPYSRLAAAAVDLVELGAVSDTEADRLLTEGLGRYRRGDATPPAYDSAVRPPVGPGGDRFYDDNAWIGLDLVRQHRVTGSAEALERADEVFAFLVSGWEDDRTAPHPGGVRWVESPTNLDRNTVSTAASALLGFALHDLLGGGGEREWAERMLAWVHESLRDPADGLYWDHVGADGTIERTKWSYNQGLVVGAELAACRADRTDELGGGSAHLARAERVAGAALAHYDGAPGGLAAQGHPFNAIFLRHLLELRALTADGALGAAILQAATRMADETWARDRGADGLVRPGGRRGRVALIDQASAVETEAVLALALGHRPTGDVVV